MQTVYKSGVNNHISGGLYQQMESTGSKDKVYKLINSHKIVFGLLLLV